jgi:serine/threonine-protein kinase HipA
MANLRYGIVTFKGERAGTLREVLGGGTVFEYDDDAPEIACGLPREISIFTWDEGSGVHPVFAHLAPEGWLRSRQSAVADAAEDDDFGLLLAFGSDCIGALGIEDPEGFGKHIRVNENLDAETEAIAGSNRTISGVQAKLLCHKVKGRFLTSSNNDPAPYIAKFAREDLTDLVANEAVSLTLCQIILGKNEVTKFTRGIVSKIEKPALIVERFDRYGSDFKSKLRCEDFAQIEVLPPGRDRRNKYNVDYEILGRVLEYSDFPDVDRLRLFARIIVFVLIGNTDCHLKNWSLLETDQGLRLSPVYDVVNSYIYGAQGYSTRFGLQIDGTAVQWDQCDRDFLYLVADKIGLPRRAADRAFNNIEKTKNKVFKFLGGELGLNEDRTYSYRTTVSGKWETIYG